MGLDENRDRRDARAVEISAAMLLGVLAGVAVLGATWLFGWLAMPPRGLWDPVIAAIEPAAVVAGVLVVLGWLVRSRRRGL